MRDRTHLQIIAMKRRLLVAKHRRGVMLVLTLWLLVVLSIIATSLISHVLMQTRLMSLRRHRQAADALARAGVAKAVADLKNDLLLDHTSKQLFDAEGDIWKRPEEGKKDIELGEGTFTVEVVDEERLINLNSASWELLTALMVQLGYEEKDAQVAAAAIVDWRDGDEDISLPRAANATEGEIYAVLAQGGEATDEVEDIEPMRIKNDPFLTVDELLSVYGITPELFYGPGSVEADLAEEELGYDDEDDRRFKIKRRRRRRRDEKPIGLRDLVTVYSNRKINLNTAPLDVLSALFRAAGINQDDPDSLSKQVIEYRRDGKEEDINNNQAFRTLEDLRRIGHLGLDPGRLNAVLANHGGGIDVKSRTFRITSTGSVDKASRTLTVIINRWFEIYTKSERAEKELEDRNDKSAFPASDDWRYTSEANKGRELGPDELNIWHPSIRIAQWIDP